MEAEIVAISKEGKRSYNEDVYGHWSDGSFIACIVSDGAGGHGGGDVASALVRQTVLEAFSLQPSVDREFLKGLIDKANLAVVAHQTDQPTQASMRATVVFAAIDMERGQMVWGHCGDSRAYLFRRGQIVARTKDHSLVQQMVDGGVLNAEDARLHPSRNLLLSALGSTDEPPEISVSDVIYIQSDDVLLLCSDGVWEPLGDEQLCERLRASATPSFFIASLDAALQRVLKPDQDNYTALTLWASAIDEVTQLVPATIQTGIVSS